MTIFTPRTSALILLAVSVSVIAFEDADAQQISPGVFQVNTTVTVLPYAELIFTAGSLLYLQIPPGGSTIPVDGVEFYITGNATTSLSAEPDAFLEISAPDGLPGISGAPGPYYLGEAENGNGDLIGYDIALQFPTPASSSARLPKTTESPTATLTANLQSGNAYGIIDLITNAEWSNQGTLPMPGLYEGGVVLTLTAN